MSLTPLKDPKPSYCYTCFRDVDSDESIVHTELFHDVQEKQTEDYFMMIEEDAESRGELSL
jgi:hypothetical protein